MKLAPLVLCALASTAAAAPTEGLLWNVGPVKTDRTGPTSVSWIDASGKVAWTTPIPEPLQFSVFGRDPKTLAWLDDQRKDNYAKYWSVLVVGDSVVISDAGIVFVVGIRDGKPRLTWTDDRPRHERGGFDSAMMDRGTVTITTPATTCTETIARQSFARMCGGQLIYFGDGQLAAFDTRSWKLAAKVASRGPDLDALHGGCPGRRWKDVDTTVDLGGTKVRFVGTRETVCKT